MAHLRMELAAANEELDFLRKREEEVQAEGARLQMVAEMNKRLGANVSRCVPSCGPSWEFGLSRPPFLPIRFELDSLRSQLESLQKEASRVQKANQELLAKLRIRSTAEAEVEMLKREAEAYQNQLVALGSKLSDLGGGRLISAGVVTLLSMYTL
eukprot:scaffold41066_cov31-Tisochrysis_lutea.AAC.3